MAEEKITFDMELLCAEVGAEISDTDRALLRGYLDAYEQNRLQTDGQVDAVRRALNLLIAKLGDFPVD